MSSLGVVIFTYDRPSHLDQLLRTYYQNRTPRLLPTTIYMDAPRNVVSEKAQIEIKKIIHSYNEIYKNLTLIKRKKNLGSKMNITSGITESFKYFNKLIILEDDLVLSEYFLEYMSDGLEYFEGSKQVYHVSGCSLIENTPTLDPYFTMYMNCWGWGTWRDKWEQICLNAASHKYDMNEEEVRDFNLNNSHDFHRQLLENRNGMISTWAILWYACIFKNNGLCLSPGISLVNNSGNDGSGERHGKIMPIPFTDQVPSSCYPEDIKEDQNARELLVQYFQNQRSSLAEIIKNIVYCLPARFQRPTLRLLMLVRYRLDIARKKRLWR